MRPIDADALEKEGWILHRTVTVDSHTLEYQVKQIAKVSTIEPEPKWIPCSERLPKEYGKYLITTHDGNVDIGTIDPENKNMWIACDSDGFYWLGEVLAWMPRPEPYREEGD